MTNYFIHTSLAGLYLPSDGEAFEAASPEDAISALLDELDYQLGDEVGDEDSDVAMDRAFVESLRGSEGRGDLLHLLATHGEVMVGLESMYNNFGSSVTLVRVDGAA